MRRTKIVATIGPACDTPEKIEEMMEAGVNVFRFNMKHNVIEWHGERMERIEAACQKLKRRVGILMDLQGPEVRIDSVPEKWATVKPGDIIGFGMPGSDGVVMDHSEILADLKKGQTVYADDGFLEFEIVKEGEAWVEAKVVEGTAIKPRKTVNFPGMHLSFPVLIEKDITQLTLAQRHHVDFVALSFVRSPEDIEVLRKELKKMDIDAKIIAKIEHPDAVEKFPEVLDAADGVMVARGDLGIEYPMEEVPALQKMMVRMCREEGKPVIVATQMLETMTTNPRPTRAEVSDVANAVYDGADAVMLSGETAGGMYPVRVVKTMARIAARVDSMNEVPQVNIDWHKGGQTAAVVAAAERLMEYGYKGVCDLKAFVVLTESGQTVEYLSRMRPKLPIIALSSREKTVDQLQLSWGVQPAYYDYSKRERVDIADVLTRLKKEELVKHGDSVIMIYGELWGEPGLTSVVRVQAVT